MAEKQDIPLEELVGSTPPAPPTMEQLQTTLGAIQYLMPVLYAEEHVTDPRVPPKKLRSWAARVVIAQEVLENVAQAIVHNMQHLAEDQLNAILAPDGVTPANQVPTGLVGPDGAPLT